MLRYFSSLPPLHLSSFAPHTTRHPVQAPSTEGQVLEAAAEGTRAGAEAGGRRQQHTSEWAGQLLRGLPHLSHHHYAALFPSERCDGAAKPVTHFHTALSSRLSPSHAPPRGGLATCFLKTRDHPEPAMFQHTTHCFRVLVLLNAIIPKFCPSPVSPDISPPCFPLPQDTAKQSGADSGEGDLFSEVTC